MRQGDPFTVEYRYSDDNGRTWQEVEHLTDEPEGTAGTLSPLRLIADGQGRVHLVFVANQGSLRGIFYRRWLADTGWEPPVEITQGEPSSNSLGIGQAVDDAGRPHVFWHGLSGAYYTQMLENETWSRPRLITDIHNTGVWPDIAVDEEGVRHFVWQVTGDALDLYYASLPPE